MAKNFGVVPVRFTMRLALFGFGIGAMLAYTLFATIGLATEPGRESPLAASAAEAALVFAFPIASSEGEWHGVSGTARHGWLLRQAHVKGKLGSIAGKQYSEQVLKVGWPFTVVRGFVRTAGDEVTREGAHLLGPKAPGQTVQFLPTQPVWPGVVLYGLIGMLGTTRRKRRRGGIHATGLE